MCQLFSASIIFSVLLTALPAAAQFEGTIYREDSSIKASDGTRLLHLAWSGGLNNPQPAPADLNNDGLRDLVIYDWGTAGVKTFINTGTPGNPHYTYRPEYAATFPPIQDYLYLIDYNADGIADLFEKGCCGFNAWKGYYNGEGHLAFSFYKELRYNSPFVGSVNAYTQASDVPGITDIDGDGDIDFFGYDINGAILSFYKNCRVEHGLPADSIDLCYPESCWGKSVQNTTRTFVLDVTDCPTFGLFGCRPAGEGEAEKPALHPGNTLCFVDIDGDGDKDLLDGNLSFSDVQLLINGNASLPGTGDKIIAQDTIWQSGGHVLQMPSWPLPTLMDYDGDGDGDLMFSPHARNTSENVKTLALYRNTGSAASPVFTFVGDTFHSAASIDAGTAAYPHITDVNGDGRPDLLIGSEGYYNGSVGKVSRMKYYQNILAGSTTVLAMVNDNLLQMDTVSYPGAAPATGDLDGDGDNDLLVGHTNGTVSYYRNDAPSATAPAQWTLITTQLQDAAGSIIDVGQSAAPVIYDLNKDGMNDVVIGRLKGNVFYYQNAPGGALSLTLASNNLGDMIANPDNTFSGYSVPFIGKMDNTGNDFLLLGNDSGSIRRYTGFQDGTVTGSYILLDDKYSYIGVGLRSAPAIGDLDGDGRYEMIVGNVLGGVQQFFQAGDVSITEYGPAAAIHNWLAFPNPAPHAITIRRLRNAPATQVRLSGSTGALVYEQAWPEGAASMEIDVRCFASGMYWLTLSAQQYRQVLPVSIAH